MTFKCLHSGTIPSYKRPIATIADAFTLAVIPDIPFFRRVNLPATFIIICTTSISVQCWPGFFSIIRSISSHRPIMAICTHFSIYIKIIKKGKSLYQLMVVRCNNLRKQTKGRITVSLFNITKNLIIGPVFFYYIKYIFYRRGISGYIG